jgi:hypothetical protein
VLDPGETPDVGILRELFRNLLAFEALFETEGIDTIRSPEGLEVSLWDLRYLHSHLYDLLPTRMAQAIELVLVQNRLEREACDMMGVSRKTPIGKYATQGLKKLAVQMETREAWRFRKTNGSVEVREALSPGGGGRPVAA